MKRPTTGALVALLGLLTLPAAAPGQGQRQEAGRRGGGTPEAQGARCPMMGAQGMMGQGMMGEGMMGRGMTGQGMMGTGMMGTGHGMAAIGPGPRGLLSQKETLELTDSQIQRLEAMSEELEEANGARATRLGSLREQLVEAHGAETPDLGRIESLLKEISAVRIEARMEAARAGQRALSVLTEEQRARVRSGGHGMHGMMGGGAMHGGMMRGGNSQPGQMMRGGGSESQPPRRPPEGGRG